MKNPENVKKALIEYEKRITVKRWYFAVKLYISGFLDALSSDLLKFLCFEDRKPGEGPRLPPPLAPPKKLTDLHDHQTDQSRFYLCCGYKGVGVHFVQRIATYDRKKLK